MMEQNFLKWRQNFLKGLEWAFLKVLSGEGLESISIPYSLVGGLFIASGFVGVFAALWPASRAAKTPPLETIRR